MNCKYYLNRHANGEKIILVDQNRNSGRWNSLGRYSFQRGAEASITVSNNANGPVIADAIKLVYLDNTPVSNHTSP